MEKYKRVDVSLPPVGFDRVGEEAERLSKPGETVSKADVIRRALALYFGEDLFSVAEHGGYRHGERKTD